MSKSSSLNGVDLKAWREKLGFNKDQAARQLGLDPKVYRTMEKDEVEIPETVMHLCGALILLDIIKAATRVDLFTLVAKTQKEQKRNAGKR